MAAKRPASPDTPDNESAIHHEAALAALTGQIEHSPSIVPDMPPELLPENRRRARTDAQQAMKAARRWGEKSAQTLPSYELDELIGRGAYGRVYKA